MVDVALAVQPRARERIDLLAAHGVEPGELRARDRAPGRQRRRSGAAASGSSSCCWRCPAAVVLPLHPAHPRRGSAPPDCSSGCERSDRLRLTPPLGYVELDGAALQRARRADRLGRAAEGGLPRRRAVRHAAAEHRVDRDRRERLERARRSRHRRARSTALEREPPPERPPLYGDGHAPSASSRRLHSTSHERPRQRVRIGVAGLGYWGPNLARNFAAIPGCELAWCCDGSRGGASARARMFPGARFTGDLDELLADPALDAVVLATPVPTHARAGGARARGRQALLRREAARAVGRRRRARASRPRSDAGGC